MRKFGFKDWQLYVLGLFAIPALLFSTFWEGVGAAIVATLILAAGFKIGRKIIRRFTISEWFTDKDWKRIAAISAVVSLLALQQTLVVHGVFMMTFVLLTIPYALVKTAAEGYREGASSN